MKKTLVSIVTVCLNSIDYIEDTIKSVMDLDYPYIEYIVIDGGSTDGTLDVLERYEDKIAHLISEKDTGIYNAMNKGIKLASGELIGFLNSGDLYEQCAVKNVVDCYQKSGADIFYGDTVIYDETHEEKVSLKNLDLKKYYVGNPICHQSVFVRTEIQKQFPFDEKHYIMADYDFLLRMYIKGKAFQYVGCVISYYLDNGMSERSRINLVSDKRDILMDVVEENKNISEINKKHVQDLFLFDMFELHLKYIPGYIDYVKHIVAESITTLDKIIVFGTGEKAKKYVELLGINTGYYIDNNEEKAGELFCGKKIYPAKQVRKEKNGVVLVLSSAYADEMIKQLTEMNLSPGIKVISIFDIARLVEKRLYLGALEGDLL